MAMSHMIHPSPPSPILHVPPLQFKLNPPQLEIPDDILAGPAADYALPTVAEALEDAKVNAWPDRTSRRYAM